MALLFAGAGSFGVGHFPGLKPELWGVLGGRRRTDCRRRERNSTQRKVAKSEKTGFYRESGGLMGVLAGAAHTSRTGFETKGAGKVKERRNRDWRMSAISVVGWVGLVAGLQASCFARSFMEGEVMNGQSHDGALVFRLSEGDDRRAMPRRIAPAAGDPLSAQESATILSRLAPLAGTESDVQAFALRDSSLPAPLTGKSVETQFPPAGAESAAGPGASGEADPLKVLRFSPEGEVPLAARLSVTFSQPMVALTSHGALAGKEVPVRLQPSVDGAWRWIGTKTLLFEPKTRFPMATDFQVEVPAGTRSVVGGTLAKSLSFSFSTPPPTLGRTHPVGGPQGLRPMIFAAFDQEIEPSAVLGTTELSSGQKRFPVRLATEKEIQSDAQVKSLAEAARKGRWIALVPESELPVGTTFQVSFLRGTASLEGPRRTTKAQGFSFGTYGVFKVRESRCGWGGECPPFVPWNVQFSNPLDVDQFSVEQVVVEPPLPGLQMDANGDRVTIRGRSKARTTYKVTFAPGLSDIYGQTLGKEAIVSFQVGVSRPLLWASGGAFQVLDPEGRPEIRVYSVNHGTFSLKVNAVEPGDWDVFTEMMKTLHGKTRRPLPGRNLVSKTIEVDGPLEELCETTIDLTPYFSGNTGQLVVEVSPTSGWRKLLGLPDRHRQNPIAFWVQATRIGLTAIWDQDEFYAWATSLADGSPLEGVEIQMLPLSRTVRTGADGLASFSLPAAERSRGKDQRREILVARKGEDVAILPATLSWWSGVGYWKERHQSDSLLWYVFDDRKLYKPGESVRVKGWIRKMTAGTLGDVGLVFNEGKSLDYRLLDSRRNELASGQVQLGRLGGFDLQIDLPDSMNLGNAVLELNVGGSVRNHRRRHTFQVQEFRRPEFEVSAAASEAPHFVGGSATVTASAKYYSGGPLPGAEVRWTVKASRATYSPPNWSDFTFGTWHPWWRPWPTKSRSSAQTFQGKTGPKGEHHLRIDLVSANPPQPMHVAAEASIMDVNRQAWAASADFLVHPAELYVGIRSPRSFVEQGEPLKIDLVVTDLDGNPQEGREIELQAVRQVWGTVKGAWKLLEKERQARTLPSGPEPVPATFDDVEPGTWKITARILDDQGRINQSEMTVWVAGGKMPASRKVEEQEVQLIPDRKDYQSGQTARILVQAPFAPAEGLLTIRRDGLLKMVRFSLSGSSKTLEIPIEDSLVPNVHIQVDLVGAASRTDEDGKLLENVPKRPAYATGRLKLSIPPISRTLEVQALPARKAIEPGGKTPVKITVKDSRGQPVQNAEVTLFVVDEAVLALTGYQLADPVQTFYPSRGDGVRLSKIRKYVQLATLESLELPQEPAMGGEVMMEAGAMPPPSKRRMRAMAMAPGAAPANGGGGGHGPAIAVRKDFRPLAAFFPLLQTDAEGTVSATLNLPDSLTRYRILAVAVAGDRSFGKGESSITVRLPLMVRPSPPRFLNFGDRAEIPIVVQNQTETPLRVSLAFRATGVELSGNSGRSTLVPPNDRVEIRFPVQATQVGRARFQAVAVSGRWSDAAEFDLPVWTPATTEAFATYGQLDEGSIVQPVSPPPDVVPQFGGLQVTTSSTALQALTDAVVYLYSYPFECSEQLASRVLDLVALEDVLSAFQSDALPSKKESREAIQRDLKKLAAIQNHDGGFPLWQRGDRDWPYVTIHVAHALARLKAKNHQVPQGMLEKAQRYLASIDSHIPGWYGQAARHSMKAYALYVRHLLGDTVTREAEALVQAAGLDNLPLEAAGWIYSASAGNAMAVDFRAKLLRHFQNRVAETAAGAHFVTSYGDGDYLLMHSARRTDAIILEGLINNGLNDDLVVKLVRGLLDHRKKGRWASTQENVFVLLALNAYFRAYESVTPDFVARIWLGDGLAAEHAYRGRTTDSRQVEIPMSFLAKKGAANLVLQKEGPGRLYYRLGMSYAPRSLNLEAADHGFTVERSYEAVNDKGDVRRDESGVWHVRAGAEVRVRITMVAPMRRYHVALVDKLPAGLEILNPALKGTGSLPQDPKEQKRGWWWFRTWYEHQNLRDERVEAFASLLWNGVHTYSYVTRATTPGDFVVPPAKAEEMYHPETFGRSSTDRLIVETPEK